MNTSRILENFKKIVTNRLVILTFFVCLLFFILFNRIFNLQIVEGEMHEEKFKLSVIRDIEIEGYRGKIFDRYGYPLAENKLAYKVVIDDSVQVDDKNKVLHDLITVIKKNGDEIIKSFPILINKDKNFVFSTESESQINRFKKDVFIKNTLSEEQEKMTAEDMFIYLRDEYFEISNEEYTNEEALDIMSIRYALWLKRYSKYQPQELAVNISQSTLAEIEENNEKFPGVSIIEDPLRVYNDAKYFSHIIGYTGKIDSDTLEELEPLGYDAHDIVGKTAIEKEMEVYLKGEDGVQSVEVNNLGRKMEVVNVVEPSAGKDVFLTIDRELQIKAYDILEKQLAEIVAGKLSHTIPSTGAKDVVLLKDVYKSFFNNGLISLDKLEKSGQRSYQRIIYNTFLYNYNQIISDIKSSLEISNIALNKKHRNFYNYILDHLVSDGFLSNEYSNSKEYEDFKKDKISFKQMLEEFIKNTLVIKKNEEATTQQLYEQISKIILEEYVKNHSFKKSVYVKIADYQGFSYTNLAMVLIEQGIVNSSEGLIASLKSGRLSSIEFMRQKILSLEITPQQVGQDPSSGAIVVTDVNTGEVLALVSYPSYDNNMLVNNFDYEYYLKQLNDSTKPLYPRATQERKAPGSTYKMVVAMAGLEEGVIGRNERINSIGIFTKIFPAAKCWIYSRGGTHGPINVIQALEVSCNYFFYEVGFRLSINENGKYIDSKGISKLNEYASKFGLDSKTGIEIGEVSSNLAEQDAVRSSIGQGTHNYTPVQLARYVATLANGGTLFELNLIDNIKTPKGEVYFDKTPAVTLVNDFDEENVKTVHKGTFAVTHGSNGTSRYTFAGMDVAVAGKTGTAQQSTLRPDHALFVGFAPYENPEIAVVSMIPFGHTSTNTAETVKKVVEAYYSKSIPENYSYGNVLE